MDQSKADVTPDQTVRATALTWALQAHSHAEGWPPEVINTAREFYLFLKGNDPVIDRGQSDLPDGETAEVIDLNEYRKRRDDPDQ